MIDIALSETSQNNHQQTQANKKSLRTAIRKKRRSLSARQQRQASQNLLKHIKCSGILLKHRHIALYLGNDGEIDPTLLIKHLLAQKKHVYLPIIHPISRNELRFCKILPGTTMVRNIFGILEPEFDPKMLIKAEFLSLVLLPLVAFDKDGNRMGMGGGFYDRSFAYKLKQMKRKPKLIGVAHSFQQQAALPVEAWDVPLDGILTDLQFFRFR